MAPFDTVDAIVLAGGLGRRLRDAVPDLPKPLAPVCGRPFLDLVLFNLRSFTGLGRVVLAVGYRAERIEDAYRDRVDLGFPVLFSVEREPLGTGGAIRLAMEIARTEELLVVNGDSFAEVNWEAFRAFHRDVGADLTMLLRDVEDPGRFGRVTTDGTGRIVAFDEKREGAPPGPINAGVYLFRRSLVEALPVGEPRSLERDLVPAFLAGGVRLFGFTTPGKFIDIGLPETWREAQDCLGSFFGSGGETLPEKP